MKDTKCFWLTGLSGAGKTTIAKKLQVALLLQGETSFIVDGDELRKGLCSDLGFSNQDRQENIRRAAEVTKMFIKEGHHVIVSLISPFAEDRQKAKTNIGESFLEIHVNCPFDVCEERDPKGLYAKMRTGEIQKFTGKDSPYEPPLSPDLRLDTHIDDTETCILKIMKLVGKDISNQHVN